MNIFIISLFLISLVSPLQEVPENYTLIFKQDFTSEEDFESNWDYEIGTGDNGWGNSEKQYSEHPKIIFIYKITNFILKP